MVMAFGGIGLAGGGAVVGGVKTLTLKHNADRLENLAQGRLTAFRAINQGVIREFLVLIKADSAIITMVRICWHN
jgi:hypothetical protein